MTILTVNNVSKSYGIIQALNNVSTEISEGCVHGILGPNGSGKTTLLGVISGVLKPDSGSFNFFETDEPDYVKRKQIGILLETPNFYPYLSAIDNLKIACNIKNCTYSNIETVLQKVNLHSRRQSKYSSFSLGMKQRLAIASTLLANPKVLVLDEPTNGLDPEGIADIRMIIQDLAKQGKTVIVSSHLLDEIEKVCTHVTIINKGKKLTSGKVNEILVDKQQIEVKADNMQALMLCITDFLPNNHILFDGQKIVINKDTTLIETATLNEYCFSKGITLTEIVEKKQNLESFFLNLLNKQQ